MAEPRKQNPYTLVFGREPGQMIIEMFSADVPPQQVFMITGVRGSGKTVFLSSVSEYFGAQEDWICVELSTEQDMLRGLAAQLASDHALAHVFPSAKINLSLFGFGLEVTGSVPVADIGTALGRMLESIQRRGKKLLICVDEVFVTENLRVFCSTFQIFVRQKLPVFLLMSGLYENIEALQNTPNLTFLYRATRVVMSPLSQFTIADNYQEMFSLHREEAVGMAAWTRGYSFAFQVLGFSPGSVKDRRRKRIRRPIAI